MARKSSVRSVDPMSPSIPSSRSCCSSMPRSAASVCGARTRNPPTRSSSARVWSSLPYPARS
jgi:hypothetical protein